MDEYQKIILENNREYILKDLTDLEEILIALRPSGTLNENDVNAIYNSQDKGAKLLDIFKKKNDGLWFFEFCRALDGSYPWIGKTLIEAFDLEADKKKEFYLQIRGSVPLPPQHNVHRSQLIGKLRNEITCLKRHSYLVIHGMSGCGKTSLASDALNDITLLENSLKGSVYWLSVGELQSDETAEDLLCQELQKKLCDNVGLAANPQKDLLSQLKHFFAFKQNYDALLVLDNVVSSNVLKALDIGCKTLVTTHDCGVLQDVKHRCNFFPVQNGFNESESVQLLTDFVTKGMFQLPPKIRQCAINIHHVWKGQPMVISLIGGHLAEKNTEALEREACWKEFEKNPAGESNGDLSFRRWSLVEQQISTVIAKTIGKLDPELQNLYQMMVVLVEDANITCSVLETLWKKHETDAEFIINTLCRRSLAVKKHHPQLKVWIYGVHAMLVSHMKENLSTEELKNMHKELLIKYYEKCEGDFSELPEDDNYFFTYICHHIEKAGEWNTYRDQFFSLKYLRSKLLVTGPGDLLLDLHKYQKGLVGDNDNYRKQVVDIARFVESSGWDVYKHKVDIIQCALLESEQSIIHKWANEECSETSNIYFIPINNQEEKRKELEMLIPNVKALCLIPSSYSDGRVLIAPDHKEGHISEVDLRYRRKRRSFEVPNVSLLSLSKYQDKFLSVSDGVVKVFSLTENTLNANTPPPSMRQRNYEDFHLSDARTTPIVSRNHNACVRCASFSPDGKLIVSASDAGDVVIWNIEAEPLYAQQIIKVGPSAVTCIFLTDSDMIVYGCSDHKIYFCDVKSGAVKVTEGTDRNLGRIISILPIAGDNRKLIVVQSQAVSLWCWDAQTLAHQVVGSRLTELQALKKFVLHEETSHITCAAYADHCLVIGTSQRGCCHFKMDEPDMKKCWIGSGGIKAVDVTSDRLVYATGGSIRMCWPEMGSSSSNPSQNCIVSLGWFRNVSVYATTSRNKLLVYHDGKLINDRPFLKDISTLCVSLDGFQVAVGCCDGEVLFLDSVAKTLKLLTTFSSEVTYLQFRNLNDYPVCVAAAYSNNGMDAEIKEKGLLQVINERNNLSMRLPGISSRVVETFAHASLLIVVLSNYSVVVWNLHFYEESNFQPAPQYVLQEGRKTAEVTGASLSLDRKILVLSDEEKCFHVFFIDWPDICKNNDGPGNIVPRLKKCSLKLHIPSQAIPSNALSLSPIFHSIHNRTVDEVDGGVASSLNLNPYSTMATYELPEPAWCCDVSSDGHTVALGCGVNKVHVWDAVNKMEMVKFNILPNSHAKVSHLKFSSNTTIARQLHKLLLFVVSDCFSLWDLSPLLQGNGQPTLLGCVKSGGPFVDVSVNDSFSKFVGVDSSGAYYLWTLKD